MACLMAAKFPVGLGTTHRICLGLSPYIRHKITTPSFRANVDKSEAKESVPEWAKPGSDVPPPWVQETRANSTSSDQDLPFYVYLICSSLVAIAAIGSVFEYYNKNAIFGVLPADNAFYAPILGFFAITGLPTSGFLLYKSIQLANKASIDQDKDDGY